MFVITADQVGSRLRPDLVADAIDTLNSEALRTELPAERTVGDELQVLIADAEDALQVILQLTRTGDWSVGCGIGSVATPLPDNIREATGSAFLAARRAVDRAKGRLGKFALETEPTTQDSIDAESLIDLLLSLRAKRSAEGWELHDLMADADLTQAGAAKMLGISAQAVSLRARAAGLRTEQAALPPLTRVLRRLDSVEPQNTEANY